MTEKDKIDETLKRKHTFKKFTYHCVDLDQLLNMLNNQPVELMHSRALMRFSHGLKRRPIALIKKLRKAKKEAPPNEKPEIVNTLEEHYYCSRDDCVHHWCIHGKDFSQVEIKPEMIGHYLGEFSFTYKLVKHGRPGIGAVGEL